jgi:hypothetical protein
MTTPPPRNNPASSAAGAYLADARRAGADCLRKALDYLGYGWASLAVCTPDHVGVGKKHAGDCKSPGKAPWGPWAEFQTRLPTEAELRQKWRDNPMLNVGMTLGGITGLIGLDSDEKGGEELLARLSRGDLPQTLEFTSGKGRRLLYRVPAGVELRPTPKPGGLEVESGELRLLGLGSQTVMPPSRHKDTGRRYAWVPGHAPGEIEPAVAPAWVVELMRKEGKGQGKRAAAPADGEPIREGSRNSTLTSLAGTMRRRGLDEAAIAAALLVVNATRCEPPLAEAEVRTIAASVCRYAPAANGADARPQADGRAGARGESPPPGDPGFTLGPLRLVLGRGRKTASGKVTVPVEVYKGGLLVDQLVLSSAPSARKAAARQLGQHGADPAEAEKLVTRIIAHAAGRAARGEEGPTLAKILADRVPPAWGLAFRTDRGAWSEARGCEVTRQDFVSFCPNWLIDATATAADAPRDGDGRIDRAALVRQIETELRVVWSDLLSTLGPPDGADLTEQSVAAARFRETVIRIWSTPVTFEKEQDANGRDLVSSATLASRVTHRARSSPGVSDAWHQVHPAYAAYWRRHVTAGGEEIVYLAMRFTLDRHRQLQGVTDQKSLCRLGKLLGSFEKQSPVPDRLTGGDRLAVLTAALSREILETPAGDTPAGQEPVTE